MAEEMFRLQMISRGKTYVYNERLVLRDGAQSEDSEEEQEAGTGAATGVGAQARQGEHMLRQPLESSEEVEEAEEADEGGGKGQGTESTGREGQEHRRARTFARTRAPLRAWGFSRRGCAQVRACAQY